MKIGKFIIALLFICSISFGQGVIFEQTQALKLFGPVKQSFSISASELQSWANENSKVGFKIAAGNLFVADDSRDVFYRGSKLPAEELIHYFGSDKITELIELDGAKTFTVESRMAPTYNSITDSFEYTEVLTISGIIYTMELSQGCPPICRVIKLIPCKQIWIG